MPAAAKTAKSFGPQDLPKIIEVPVAAWSVDRLQEFAQQQHAQIQAKERSLATLYWQLGAALHHLRMKLHLRHGQWEQFLLSNKITPTRASKARAIYGAFQTPDELKNLSVDEAYARRKDKQPESTATKSKRKAKAGTTPPNTPKTFQISLQDVVDQAETFQPAGLQKSPSRRRELLDVVAAAITKLEALRQRLTAMEESAAP